MRRRVFQQDDIRCLGGCSYEETACHLFVGFATFGSLRSCVSRWLGINFVASNVVCDHLLQFGHLAGLPRFTLNFMKLIWFACVWVIWKERNNRVFNQKTLDVQQLTDKVKLLSFQWLKACLTTFNFSYHDWWRRLLPCMCILL